MAIKFEYAKPGVVPTKYQITQNDIVINTADEVAYFKDRFGEIRSIGNGEDCIPYDDSNVLFRDDANREVTPANKLATMDDISTGGDDNVMLKSVYDTNDNGIVDDSEKVNGLTVETAVPANAVFTDTTYTDAEIKTKYENNADTNAFSDTEKSKLAGIDTSLYEEKANKGVVDGYAELDSNGKVPTSQLPSYVDSVQEYDTFSDLPSSGEHNIIYVTLDDNKTYRWSGSQYVEISASLALGETSSTAYRGDRGKIAYDHSQTTHAPIDAEKNVQSDWDATSGDAEILNKPHIDTYVNIEDYGAIGDDSTDNTTAIQDAINYAVKYNKVVLIPSGTFRFTNLSTDRALNITGLGVTSVLKKMSADDNGIELTGSAKYHARFTNFALISGTTQTSGTLLYTGDTHQSTFDNLLLDEGYYGIYAYKSSQCSFRWIRSQNSEENGIVFVDCLDMYVDDVRSDNNGKYGLHVDTVSGVYATNVTCYGNESGFNIGNTISSPEVADANAFHFYVNCIADTSEKHNWNIDKLTRSNFTTCWGATQSQDGTYYGFNFTDCQNITMNGGNAINNKSDGIHIDSNCSNIGIAGMNINGNGIGAAGGYGVSISGDYISVTSNIFTGNGSGNIYGGNTTSTIYANTPDDTSILGTATNYGIKYPDGSLVCVLVGADLTRDSAYDYLYTWTLPVAARDANYAVNTTFADTVPLPDGDPAKAREVVIREKDKTTTDVVLNAWTNGLWTGASGEACKVSATLHGRWR